MSQMAVKNTFIAKTLVWHPVACNSQNYREPFCLFLFKDFKYLLQKTTALIFRHR
jgi:hypothetical protein